MRECGHAFGDPLGTMSRHEPIPPELLGAVAHALAGPLITGRVAADALAARHPGDQDAQTLVTAMARTATLLDGLVRITGSGRTPFPETVSLDDAVRVALRRVRAAGGELEVEAAPLDPVRADEAQVQAILYELLGNVAAHAGPDARAMLRSSIDGGVVRLVVADLGPGLPATVDRERPGWFARSSSGSTRSGSGLAVAHAAAAINGGRLELRDGPLGGVEAVVELPAAEA